MNDTSNQRRCRKASAILLAARALTTSKPLPRMWLTRSRSAPALLFASGVRSTPMLAFWTGAVLPKSGTLLHEKTLMTSKRQRGFSLLEMIMTVAIGLTLAGVTFMGMMPMFQRNHADLAYETTLAVLRDTRHLAITQSHQYYVNFNPAGFAPGTMQVTYQPPANPVTGALPPVQQVATYSLPTDISFAVMPGFPSAPDGFGTGAAAIDFGQGVGAGGLTYVCFMPDGTSRDNLGNYNSGVVYMSRTFDPNPYNSRSISVWGATGRVRGWRLVQQAGAAIWIQQ
jgi:prepilin-type N-terminal cleavage/methylation domain-containing protein